MNPESAFQKAIAVMGEGQPDDYVIAPTHHAEEFAGKSPALAEILKSRAVQATAREFGNKDKEALTAQGEFKRVFSRANVCVLITGVLIAILLAAGVAANWLPDWLVKALIIAMSLGSVISGALATKDLFAIKEGHLLENRMTSAGRY